MRSATSGGVEKKNGGSILTPLIGMVVKTNQTATATSATEIWSARSFTRDMLSASRLRIAAHDFRLEHVPDVLVQRAEREIELDLGDVTRPGERNRPFADDLSR